MPGIYFGNMEKQNSIDWLIDKLIEHQIIKVDQTTYGDKVNYKHEILVEQAKKMHMEEICNAHYEGQKSDRFSFTWDDHPEYWSSEYYIDTFKNL